MAHFLSEVTLQKMDARREDNQKTQTESLWCQGNIMGYIRCATAAVKTDIGPGEDPVEVWCGEQDGAIVVRNEFTGEALRTIERKAQVFVFCMVATGGEVWAGLSDGFIRVFDTSTDSLMEEFKAHCASVNAMVTTVAGDSDPMRIVFSASQDWTIAKWDAESVVCLARYNGHNNGIKSISLACSGDLLISGSDDRTVRLWSASTHLELNRLTVDADDEDDGGGWPIHHTNGTPTAISVVNDNFVLIGTSGGTINVHSLSDAAFVRELEQRPCAITAIMHDTVNQRIYCAGVDGVISLYDDRPSAFLLVGTVMDHSGTYIGGITPLRRESMFDLWAMDDSGNLVRFRNNERLITGKKLEKLDRYQQEIDVNRSVVIHNYNELEELRYELRRLEVIEEQRKTTMSTKIGDRRNMKREYLEKSLFWLTKRKHRNNVQNLAIWMERLYKRRILSRYMFNLHLYYKLASDARRKRALSDTLLHVTSTSTATRFSLMLFAAASKAQRAAKLMQAAERLLMNGDRGVLYLYFMRWMKWRSIQHSLNAQREVARAIIGQADTTLLTMYWQKLANKVREQEIGDIKANILRSLGRVSARGLLVIYLAKWLDYRKMAIRMRMAHERRMENIKEESTVESNLKLCRRYMRNWMRFLDIRQVEKAVEEKERLRQEREMWEELVNESAHMTPETIAAEREAMMREIEEKKAALERWEAAIREQNHQNYGIQRDITTHGAALELDPSMSLEVKMSRIMMYLKARSVNLFSDVPDIVAVREASIAEARKAATSSPATRVTTPRGGASPRTKLTPAKTAGQHLRRSIHGFRDRIKAAMKTLGYTVPDQIGDDWGLTFHGLDKMRKKEVHEVLKCLKEVVVRYDILVSQHTHDAAIDDPTASEFILNSYIFIHLTNQQFQSSALEYEKRPSIKNSELKETMEAVRRDDGGDAARLRHRGTTVYGDESAPAPRAGKAPSPRPTTASPRPKTASPRPKTASPRPKVGRATSPAARTTSPAARAAAPRPAKLPVARASAQGAPAPSSTAPQPSPRAPTPTAGTPRAKPATKPAAKGSAPRPYMGFKVGATPAKDALVITDCAPADDCPAVIAGLQVGDKLLRFANFVVTDLAAFNAIVGRHVKVGASLPVQVQRNGETLTLTIAVGARAPSA